MFRRNLSIILALLVVVSMLVACGGGAEPTTAPTQPPAAAAPTNTPVPPADTPVPPTAEPVAEATVAMTVTEVMTPTEAAPEATALPAAFKTANCPAGSPTLTIWADDTRTPVLVQLAPKVLTETGVCLDIQELAFGDIRTKMSLSAPAGEGPDIFVMAHDWLGELTANGIVAPMDLGTKAPDFDPVSVTAMTYDGTLYGLPYAVESVGFFCNADLVPTPPTTFDEVQAMSKEMKDAGKVTQFLALQTADPYHNEPVNTAFGGYIFGTSDKGYEACDVGLDSEGAIAYLTWLDTMVKAGLLDPNVDGNTAETLFKTGKAACIITGPWNVKPFQDAGVNFTMSPFPKATQDGSPFVGVQGFGVNAFSPNKVLAQSFLQDYVATNEVQEAIYKAGNRPPAYMPARAVMDDIGKSFADVIGLGHPMPAIPAMNSVWSAWQDAIKTVMLGSATPEQAAATAAKQVRDASKCP